MTLGYTTVLWILVGAYCYAGLAHLQVGLRRPFRPLHVLFGIIAFLAAYAAGAQIGMATATSSSAYLAAAWHSIIAVNFLFALLPWSVRDFVGERLRWPAVLVSATYLSILTTNFFLPYSMMLSDVPQLGHATLPWGEAIVTTTTPPHPVMRFYWVAHLLTIAYLIIAIHFAFQRRPLATAWTLLLSASPFIAALIVNVLIGFGVIKSSFFFGSFGFMAMILAMSVVLSESLRRSSKQMQTVLDNVPAIVYLKRRDGRYAFVNRLFEQAFGVSTSAALGKLDAELFTPERAALHSQADHEVLAAGATVESEEVIERDGKSRTFATLRFPLRDRDNIIYAICGISTDITERKAAADAIRSLADTLERRVTRRTQELAQLNRELEAFAYSVSHDLRAPLTAVNGFAELLLREHATKLDQTAQRYLHRIRDGSLRMATLIQDLLGLSRVTQQKIERKAIDLAQLAKDALKPLIESEPHRAVTVIIPDSLPANGDPKLLMLALTNLLSNALKYTSKTQEARVEVGAIEQPSEVVYGEVVYFVKDNGAGFNSEHADRLFRPFVRLHPDSEFPGTGIGLATVARIIARHSGRIWATAQPGAGATFFFTLPASDEEPPEVATYVESADA